VHKACSNPNCNGNRRDKFALKTTCIKNVKLRLYQIKDCLSECRMLSPQRTPKPGRTKPSTGLHAARGLDKAVLNKAEPYFCEIS